MARNVFFDNFNNIGEQQLIEDLIVEAVSIYGHDVFYCPRTVINKDDIYGEDTISEYNSNHRTTMYIQSFDSFEGDGTFLSQYNLEIRDQIKLVIPNRTFNKEVASQAQIFRPQEGDLIFSEMMDRIFVIMFVDDKATFYQMGTLQTYTLTCEVWEYSSEKLNTGIPIIDSLEDEFSIDKFNASILLGDDGEALLDDQGYPLILGQFDYEAQNKDVYADNLELEEETIEDNIVDWSEIDPFSEGGY